jgi:hypothetical protein
VRIVRVGDLAHLDAMLDPVIADQLHATLAAMTKATRTNATRTDASRTNATSTTQANAASTEPPRVQWRVGSAI